MSRVVIAQPDGAAGALEHVQIGFQHHLPAGLQLLTVAVRIIYGLNGQLVRFLQTREEEISIGSPADFDTSLEFDPATNEQIVTGLNGQLPGVRWQDASLIDGVLYYNGNPVTVNPPGPVYLKRQELRDWYDRIDPALATIDAAVDQTEQAEAAWPGQDEA